MTILRRARSLTSTTRGQVIVSGSMSSGLPWVIELSTMAASRLCASEIAWTSPVRCRFRSSMGTTWARPPPDAPPLMPKVGPSDGCRMVAIARHPIRLSAIASPTVVVVLPSPSGVGELDKRHEDRARADRVGELGPPRELAAPRRHADRGAVGNAEPPGVGGVDRDLQARRQLEQTLHAARERAAVPVVEEAPRVQDERVLPIGQLGGRGRLERGDEPAAPARARLRVEEARPGMVGRWTGPLQAALAVEARVGEPAEDRGKPRHLR